MKNAECRMINEKRKKRTLRHSWFFLCVLSGKKLNAEFRRGNKSAESAEGKSVFSITIRVICVLLFFSLQFVKQPKTLLAEWLSFQFVSCVFSLLFVFLITFSYASHHRHSILPSHFSAKRRRFLEQ